MSLILKLLKLHGVLALTATGRSTHYLYIKQGLMVPPVSQGVQAVAYPEHEIQAIIAARIAGKSDDEIRSVVADLVKQRKEVQQ
ncbi:MAG: AlpA family phage regulatory protein [Methylotenera sp.]|nr:AlpA family phage regulatory protein [Methylotenera sp.]